MIYEGNQLINETREKIAELESQVLAFKKQKNVEKIAELKSYF